MLAPTVTLAHRPKDSDIVKTSADAALKQYKEVSGRESKLDFDGSLPDDSAGGIIGSTMQGRIKVDNTLDERLKILEEKACHCCCKGRELTASDVARAAK